MNGYEMVTVYTAPVNPGARARWPRITGAISAIMLARQTLKTEIGETES